MDTGGIEPNTDNQILAFMREQAQIAIDNADVIIFVTDIKTGLTASTRRWPACSSAPASPSCWQ